MNFVKTLVQETFKALKQSINKIVKIKIEIKKNIIQWYINV